MLYIYYAVLFVAIVLGLLFGMALYRWFHYRDIYEVGELLIGEEDSPDWPYLTVRFWHVALAAERTLLFRR